MHKLLIIQNVSHEGPGLLAGVLEAANVGYDVVNLDAGEPLPELKDYAALVVLGGPDSANDTTDKMTVELAYVRTALDVGMPYLGICLGLQVLVKAAGGAVVRAEQKETGFVAPDGVPYTVVRTAAGRSDPLLIGLPDTLPVFQLHGETVEPTNMMTLLARGAYCQNQIIRAARNAYGIQSHFELTPEMLAVWAAEDPDLTPLGNDRLQADFAVIKDAYVQTGEHLLRNFLVIAGLV